MIKKSVFLLLILLSACVLAADVQSPPSVAGECYLTDYPDLQAAVNACPNGGTVIVPAGVHEIGTVTVQSDEANNLWGKVVTIRGVGHGHLGQSPALGAGQWDYLLEAYPESYVFGSVLRGHIVVGFGGRLYLQDVTMIGHAEGIAVDYGDGVNMFPEGGFRNVSIGNYETGIRIRKGYYMTLDDISMAGVGTGIYTSNSNVVTLSGINIMSCTLGAELRGTTTWTGGSVQGCENGIKFYSGASYLGGVYFEHIADTSLFVSGWGAKVDPNFYATDSGKLIVDGYNSTLDLGWTNDQTEFTENSMYNKVTLFGEYVDNGYLNEINP